MRGVERRQWRCLGGGGGRTVTRKRREGCWRDRGEIETDMKRLREKRWDISEAEVTDGTEVGWWLWGAKDKKITGCRDARPAMQR